MKLRYNVLALLLFLTPIFAYSQSVSSIELLSNGDFEDGMTGYETKYSPFKADVNERASYALCKNPIDIFNKYQFMTDHTSGHGYMVFFDSDTTVGTIDTTLRTLCLRKVISGLSKNTNYSFSFWTRNNSLYKDYNHWHPKLVFAFNNVFTGDTIRCFDTTKWINNKLIWYSGEDTNLTIDIYNSELAKYDGKDGVANDFGIDDLSLRKICNLGIDMPDKLKICEGDTSELDVVLTGSAQSESFEWTADNSINVIDPYHPKFFPKVSQYYYLEVVEEGGCDIKDSVFIEVHKQPIPKLELSDDPVICPCRDLTITASAGDNTYPFKYLWNDGNTNAIRQITEPGIYRVTISNQIGCSKSIETTITGIAPNVSVSPAELSVNTGDSISFPLNISINEGILDCGYTNLKIKLSYLKSLLVPEIKNGIKASSVGDIEYLEYEGPVISDYDHLFNFVATLGTNKCTDIIVEELNFNCNEINFNIKNGKVCLNNVCSEPNDRLFTETNEEILGQNYPNPSNGNTEINFSLSSPGFTQLVIYDASGAIIDIPVSGELKAEDYSIKINTESLNSGVYLYVLKTEYDTYSKVMQVIK